MKTPASICRFEKKREISLKNGKYKKQKTNFPRNPSILQILLASFSTDQKVTNRSISKIPCRGFRRHRRGWPGFCFRSYGCKSEEFFRAPFPPPPRGSPGF